jgi:hypothetical protein
MERLIRIILREYIDQAIFLNARTWSESWQIFANITTRIARILHLTIPLPKRCLKKAKSALLTSANYSGNHIAAVIYQLPVAA